MRGALLHTEEYCNATAVTMGIEAPEQGIGN